LKKKVRACESKWTLLKKDYKEIKWLKEEVSGFEWNDDTQMVDATDEVWEELRKVLLYILIV
jgi:Myb/SANT-like DNA-binding domain